MKKIISTLLCLSLLLYSSLFASASSIEQMSETVISKDQVSDLKEQFDISTQQGKYDYVYAVFDQIDANHVFSEMINDAMVDKLIQAETFGYINSNKTDPKLQTYGIGSTERTYDNMNLGLVWANNGSEYTLLGGCEWTKLPIMRMNDVISIDLGGGSIVNNSQACTLQYKKDGILYNDEYSNADENYCGTGTACVFKINLPNNADSMSFLISYSIINSFPERSITLQYFHQFLPCNISISASMYVGISVSPSSLITEYNLQCGIA